jgi:uncharacterized membrane protein
MSAFELYLAVHLVCVVVWLGGSLMMQLFALRAAASPDEGTQFFVFRETGWLGQRLFIPAALLVLVTGLLMVGEFNYSLGDFWVSFGFAVLVLSFLLGSLYLGPQAERAGKLMEAEGPDAPEVKRLYSRVLLLSRIELTLLFLVVIDMAVKPGA